MSSKLPIKRAAPEIAGEQAMEQLQEFANDLVTGGEKPADALSLLKAEAKELGLTNDDAKETWTDAFDMANVGQLAEPLTEASAEARIETVRADAVATRAVTWLWPGRIPRGKLTLLLGDPDVGKTTLALDITARLSTGTTWPDDSEGQQGHVIFMSAEDDPADTLKPRLIAAGADLTRVHFLKSFTRRDHGTEEMRPGSFTLADVDALKSRVRALSHVAAVILDPISAFVGKVDAHRNADVRGLLAPLVALAASRRFAVIGIDHLNKSQGTTALYRAMGSIGWIAQARAAYLVTPDPDDETGERRLLLRLKGNLAKDRGGLAFQIAEKPVRQLLGGPVPCIKWRNGVVRTSAAEVLASKPDSDTKRDKAVDWLRGILANGSMAAGVVLTEGKKAGFTKNALHRARHALKVRTKRSDKGKGWMWWINEIRIKPQISNLKSD